MDQTYVQTTSAICAANADAGTAASARGQESKRRPTRVTVVRAGALTPQHLNAWLQIQRANPLFDSPFFRPEFVQQVARFRDDVEVAVLECDGQAIGFFAFHRLRRNVARPVGMSMSDFHGVVMASDATFDPRQLLRSCRLRAWHFDHVLAAQRELATHAWFAADSPYMDLSEGFEHYEQERRRAGSDTIREVLRKMRKIEREVGPLRLVPFTTDEGLLQRLVCGKIEQYRRIRSVNHLAEPWRIELLRSIVQTRDAEFGGMLSVLLARGQVMAIHLGLLSRGVLHVWLPTYADEFSKYSPGLIFWVRMAQEASALGIRRFDLGKGRERYKQSLKTGALPVVEGSVDLRPLARTMRYGWARMRELIRSSPLGLPVQTLLRSGRALVSYRSQHPEKPEAS
jgi:CelD/BcsL family acetyltransferase involved in cellulose biosynthesis